MSLTVALSEQPVAPEQKEAAATAQPGKPAVYFGHAGSDAGPHGGKVGGGGGGAAKCKPQRQAISDPKQLNDYLSACSYFEGGAGPTAMDAIQFRATPSNIDAEQFPHAARWYRHISSFTPAQQARW